MILRILRIRVDLRPGLELEACLLRQLNHGFLRDVAVLGFRVLLAGLRAMLLDRETSRVAIVVSTEGGMDIEQVAHDTPDKITTVQVDPVANICPHHVRAVSQALKLDGDLQKQMSPLLTNLYNAFVASDMSLLEINPLVVTAAGELLAEDLRQAQDALSEITGEFTPDDLLGRIFSSFCIGK